jgi:hypothetical protein
MFLSAAEEAVVVESPSLRCVQDVHGGEMHPSLRLNLCKH